MTAYVLRGFVELRKGIQQVASVWLLIGLYCAAFGVGARTPEPPGNVTPRAA